MSDHDRGAVHQQQSAKAAWERLRPGDRIAGPQRTITAALVTELVALGGYTHPLFSDHAYLQERSLFDATLGPPLPGEALLLLLGGMAEQSGALDESVLALLGFDDVTLRRPVFAGDTITLEMEVLGKQPFGPRRDDRGVILLRWLALGPDGQPRAEAIARMLARTSDGGSRPA